MKRSRWGAEPRAKFLKTLARTGNVTKAADAAGSGRTQMYQRRAADKGFAAAWDEAEAIACDALEAEARRRAVTGTRKPVFQGGKLVGHIKEYSDTLLMGQLKAHRPEKYRERFEHTGKDGSALSSGLAIVQLSDELVAALNKAEQHGKRLDEAAAAKKDAGEIDGDANG